MAEMTKAEIEQIIKEYLSTRQIELKDFTTISGVDGTTYVLLVQPTGTANKMDVNLLKKQLVAEIKEPADVVINEVKETGKEAALVVEAATKAVSDANSAASNADEAARVAEQAAENVKDGKTPVFGNVTAKGGDKAAVTYTLNGVDANGNPVIDVDFVLEKGADGTFLLGEKANVTAIRAIANPKRGDTWKALDTGHYWTFDGSSWNDIGEIIPADVAKKDELAQLAGDMTEKYGDYLTSSDFIYALADSNNRILFGIKKDGKPYFPNLEMNEVTTNDEFLYLLLDSANHVLFGIDKNGKPYFPRNQMLEIIDDKEDRLAMTLDAEGRILSYRKKDGTLVEKKSEIEKLSFKEVSYPDGFITQLEKDLKESGFTGGTGDWTDEKLVELPIPRVAAKINIISSRLPSSKTDDIDCLLEYWDKDGNYMKKAIILNAQGTSSMGYYRKNWGIDFVDCEIKFGNWVSQDSFHFKAYYIDSFRGKCIVGYRLTEEMYQTRPFGHRRPWDYLNSSKITALDSNGKVKKDFWTGALAHPDGFPVAAYWNGEFYGIYVWALKKHRDNYYADKKEAKNIILDGSLGTASIWDGKIDWTAFEIRNPKDLLDVDGNKYDGDNPKELSEAHELSKKVKDYIINLSLVMGKINASEDKKAEFAKYFNVPFTIDYFLQSQVVYHYDGFTKNWIWCTWDGILWTPTVYDQDSIFGQTWKGTMVIPKSSEEKVLGTSMSLPTGLLWSLYRAEIEERYKELRAKNIISVANVIKLLEEWVNHVGYDNYKKEFEKWNETPSYRSSNVNGEFWELETMEPSNVYPDYTEDKEYKEGDKCKHGKTALYGFACIKDCKGISPFSAFYENNPHEAGYYDSIGRVQNWLIDRITFLDNELNYNQ